MGRFHKRWKMRDGDTPDGVPKDPKLNAIMCFGAPKLLYATRAAAKRAASKHQSVYPCPVAEGFHIGSWHRYPQHEGHTEETPGL
jgi:hypothetical protein